MMLSVPKTAHMLSSQKNGYADPDDISLLLSQSEREKIDPRIKNAFRLQRLIPPSITATNIEHICIGRQLELRQEKGFFMLIPLRRQLDRLIHCHREGMTTFLLRRSGFKEIQHSIFANDSRFVARQARFLAIFAAK